MKIVDDIIHKILEIANRLIDHEAQILRDADWIKSEEAKFTALSLCCCAVLFSFFHVYRHLKQFTMPQIQVCVIRIILTCPVYAISSTIAIPITITIIIILFKGIMAF